MRRPIALILLFAFLPAACAPRTPTQTGGGQAISAPTLGPDLQCGAVRMAPTARADTPPNMPPITDADPALGPEDAAVTMLVYSDFQCAPCAALAATLTSLQGAHPNDVRVVFRHLPLPANVHADEAARAAEAARRQDAFWPMHDLLFARQSEWSGLSDDALRAWLADQAAGLGLDRKRFLQDFDDPQLATMPAEAITSAARSGLVGAPSLVINGQLYIGPVTATALEQITTLTLLGRRQFTDCPPFTIDPTRQYIATLHTEKGDVVIQLYADKAPLTVNSFIFLARSGWYDGITFHRVIPGFVAQTGDPTGSGFGNPGYVYVDEIDPSLHFDRPGVVGMANSGPNTNGSQFFITYGPVPSLDGGYTIFGQVISGMDVLRRLTPRDGSKDPLAPAGDLLISVTIEEK